MAKDEASAERVGGLICGGEEPPARALAGPIRHELAKSVRQQEEEARTESRRRARALIADAPAVAASHTAETTVTVVELRPTT